MSLIGTKLMTWWSGAEVGADRFGNRYYTGKADKTRRWVLYKGEPEASKVPPEWHAWLHRTIDDVPPDNLPVRAWQQEHLPNLTGTDYAYKPAGDIARGGKRQAATGDYEAWRPE